MSTPLRTEAEAAALLGYAAGTLRNRRCAGTPLLPWVPVGDGPKPRIMYRQRAIDRYIEEREVRVAS